MRHMLRTIFTVASMASLLLAVASIALWKRSFGTCDVLRYSQSIGLNANAQCACEALRRENVGTVYGRVWIEWEIDRPGPSATFKPFYPSRAAEWHIDHVWPGIYWEMSRRASPGWHGFVYRRTVDKGDATWPNSVDRGNLVIPIGSLIFVFAAVPALRWWRPALRETLGAGAGYDPRTRARCRAWAFASVGVLALSLAVIGIGFLDWSANWWIQNRHNNLFVGWFDGKLGILYRDMERCAPGLRMVPPMPPPFTNTPRPPWGGEFAGFRMSRQTGPYSRELRVELPAWGNALVLAILARALWRRRRPSHASEVQFCVSCGYDLRASAERCPECGTPISRPPGAQVAEGYSGNSDC